MNIYSVNNITNLIKFFCVGKIFAFKMIRNLGKNCAGLVDKKMMFHYIPISPAGTARG